MRIVLCAMPDERPPEGNGAEGEAPHVVGRVPPESGTRYSAWEIHDTVAESARAELGRPLAALWWSAFAAGLLISFSFLAAGFLASLTDEPRLKPLLVAAGYPLGFVIVVIGSTQLFTENTLDPILPLLEEPSRRTLRQVLRLWSALLAGNLAGACAMGALFAKTPMLPGALVASLEEVARTGTGGSFGGILYRAIFAGWLVALMAWLISTTRDTVAQVLLIWLSLAPIPAFGFHHAIAGSVEAFFRMFEGDITPGHALFGFVVPAVVGNAVGGVLLVALLFYGQVRADKRARQER